MHHKGALLFFPLDEMRPDTLSQQKKIPGSATVEQWRMQALRGLQQYTILETHCYAKLNSQSRLKVIYSYLF